MAARLSTSSALWYSLYETPPRGRIIKPKNISFGGDQVHGVESFPVMIGNTMWKWKTIELVNNLVGLTMFYNAVNKCEEKYDKKPNDSTGETEKPLFIIIPTVLMEWVTKVPQILWELHGKNQVATSRRCSRHHPIHLKQANPDQKRGCGHSAYPTEPRDIVPPKSQSSGSTTNLKPQLERLLLQLPHQNHPNSCTCTHQLQHHIQS